MRNSEEKSAASIGQQSSQNGNPKIRIAVFGQHEVGKSALTVRYLTRRFIGEYKSNTDLLYHQTVTIGHTSIDVEIVDISTSAGPMASRRKSFPIEEIQRADAFVIVYSIIDRSSFTFAQEALETITNYHNQNNSSLSSSSNSLSTSSSSSSSSSNSSSSPNASPQPKSTCPILLIANKNDLEHLRVVEKVEGLTTSMQYGCHFYELSVAENSPEVYTSFQSLISTFITQTKEPTKRKFSVSKMLGNLRIGRTSPSTQVVTSQASVVDTDILSDSTENIPAVSASPSHNSVVHRRQSSVPETGSSTGSPSSSGSSSSSNLSFCNLKSKLVELHSMKRRNNSPPICSL